MTRSKPNSDRRRVIVDLSWPQGVSVNAGIDKFSYLNSAFALTFPTVDDITSELKRLGRGPYCTRLMSVGRFDMSKWTQEIMTCWGYIGRAITSTLTFRSRHVTGARFLSA